MDQPQIRYARTRDGVNIAYYEMGKGIPYVFMGAPFTHLTSERRGLEPLLSGIASTARLVRFDPRGFGLSDRTPADRSLDGFTLDVEAVAARLELGRFILQGVFLGSMVAVNYAAQHPGRLSHLVLVESVARVSAAVSREVEAALSATDDWRFVSEALVRFFQGWDQPETSTRFAELLRDAVDLEDVRVLFDSFLRWDVTDLLPRVSTPAIIVNADSNPWAGVQSGRELAAGLLNAQLAIVTGRPYDVYQRSAELAVRSFLGATPPQSETRITEPAHVDSATAIILFTDIADSTGLTERLGDTAFRAATRALDERIRAAMRATSGTPVDGKVLGDGVMGIFASAAQAIEAARRCVAASAEVELPLHIGIHAGDVIREEGNVYGGAVNIASRVCAVCDPGEILVSATVRDLARTSAGVAFEDRGEQEMKGIAEPVRVYAVRPSMP